MRGQSRCIESRCCSAAAVAERKRERERGCSPGKKLRSISDFISSSGQQLTTELLLGRLFRVHCHLLASLQRTRSMKYGRQVKKKETKEERERREREARKEVS